MNALTFLFRPRGRIGRAEFWIGLFVHIWVLRRLAVPETVMALAAGVVPSHVGWIGALLTMVDVWLVWCHFAKRWHDINAGPIWTLALFVPALGPTIGFLVLGFVPGSRGPNRFGAPRSLRDAVAEIAAAFGGTLPSGPLLAPAPAEPVPDAVTVVAPPPRRSEQRAAAFAASDGGVVRRDGGRLFGRRPPDRLVATSVVRRRR